MEQPIIKYTWHVNALPHCDTEKLLDGVLFSIKATVKPEHPEYKPLLAAAEARRLELQTKAKAA